MRVKQITALVILLAGVAGAAVIATGGGSTDNIDAKPAAEHARMKVEPLRISPPTPTATHVQVARMAARRHASKPRRHRPSAPQPVARVAAAPLQTATPASLAPHATPSPVRHAPPPRPRRHPHRAASRPAPAPAASAPPPPADDGGEGHDHGNGHGHGDDGQGESPWPVSTVEQVAPVPPPPALDKHEGHGHGHGEGSQGSGND